MAKAKVVWAVVSAGVVAAAVWIGGGAPLPPCC